MNNGKKKKN